MSSALFGGPGASGTGGQPRSKNLVEFKAGKMTLRDKMVHSDKRKGQVYVYQSDDSLMHFCWRDRTSGIVEDDLMIFPDDIETKKVPQCTTGRVFLMKFKSSSKKMFFWMQESDANKDKDEKLWKKVNDFLNNPPPPGSVGGGNSSSSTATSGAPARGGSSAAGGAGGGINASMLGPEFAGLEGNDLQNLIGSMSEQQLQMFLGGFMPVNSPSSQRTGTATATGSSTLSSSQTSREASTVPASSETPSASSAKPATATATPATPAPTTPAPATPAPVTPAPAKKTAEVIPAPATPVPTTGGQSEASAAAAAKIQFSEFQNILGNIAGPGGAKGGPAGSPNGGGGGEVDLSKLVTLDVMAPILANKSIQERLTQYLPESDILSKDEKELRTTLTTPQFKKAMNSFGSALQSGQLGPLMSQFNLPESVSLAAAQGNLEAFAKAMEQHSQTTKGGKSTNNGGDDDQMDTK
jgi:26S proteasome regulatory subunit N13